MVFIVDFFSTPKLSGKQHSLQEFFMLFQPLVCQRELWMWAHRLGEGVLLNGMFGPLSVMVGFHLVLFYQVENAQILFFPKFSWISHYWLHWETMSISICARHSASTLFLAVFKMETLPPNNVMTASSESLFARPLMLKRNSNGANTEPCDKPWQRHLLLLRTLKNWTCACLS